jgi:hypothetical protein
MFDITAENAVTSDADELREVERLFADLEAQPAQIMDADKIDAQFLNGYDRRIRRAALLTLQKSGQELIHSVTGDRGMAVAMACIMSTATEYAKSLREFAEIMDSASFRIRLALCNRPDMEAVIRDADGPGEVPGAA